VKQWIKINLIERPFYDATGNILKSIEGRENRSGTDEFTGGGKVYPELGDLDILAWQEGNSNLMLLVEGEQTEIDALTTKVEKLSFQAYPKEARRYDFADFNIKKVADKDVYRALVDEIGLPEETELDNDMKPVFPEAD